MAETPDGFQYYSGTTDAFFDRILARDLASLSRLHEQLGVTALPPPTQDEFYQYRQANENTSSPWLELDYEHSLKLANEYVEKTILKLYENYIDRYNERQLGLALDTNDEKGGIMNENYSTQWSDMLNFANPISSLAPPSSLMLTTVVVLGVTAYLTMNRVLSSRKMTVATLDQTGCRVIADRIMPPQQILNHKLPICFEHLADNCSGFIELANGENDYVSSLVFKSSTITKATIDMLLNFNNLKSVTFIACHNINADDISVLNNVEVITQNCNQIDDATTPANHVEAQKPGLPLG